MDKRKERRKKKENRYNDLIYYEISPDEKT